MTPPSQVEQTATPPAQGEAKPPVQRRWTVRRGISLVAVAIGVAAVVAAAWTTWQTVKGNPGGGACPYQDVAPLKADPGTITLAPRTSTQVVDVVFGASREAQTTSIDFQSQKALPINRGVRLHAYVGEFTRSDGYRFPAPPLRVREGNPVPIAAYGEVAGRTTVRLTVCVDPAAPRRTAPGTYVGTVTLDDDALASPVLATLSVSLKYQDPFGPLMLTVLAVLAATYLAALADPQPGPFRAWFQDHEHLSAISFGGAAALTAYGAIYLRSGDWGADGLLAIGGLFAATFTAAAAGLTAHAAGKNAARSGNLSPESVSSSGTDESHGAG